jgi:hypothetical protein
MTAGGYQIQLFAHSSGAAVNWRLLSGNNWEAGRGPHGFSSALECRAALVELQRCIPDLRPRVRRTLPTGWTWEVHDDLVIVAQAYKPFDRMIRCQQGLEKFLDGFPHATLNPGVVFSGARRWGSVAS